MSLYSYLYLDGTVTSPVRVSLPVFSSPIPGVKDEVLLTQDWIWHRDAADNGLVGGATNPTPLNTAHPNYGSYLLVEEGPRQDMGGGFIKSQRIYAKVPATHLDWQDFAYGFIGLSGTNSITAPFIPNRPRFYPGACPSQLQFDYFIANGSTQTDPITGSSKAINSAGDIDKIWAMQYCSQIHLTAGSDDALIGGIAYPVQALNQYSGTGGTASDTVPTLEQYYQIILPDAYTNLWAATKSFQKIIGNYNFSGSAGSYTGHFGGVIANATSGTGIGPRGTMGGVVEATILGGLIPVEDSSIDRWRGNIWVRRSRYMLAQ